MGRVSRVSTAISTAIAHLSPLPGTLSSMLTVRDHMTLRFEERRYRYAGKRETDVREIFGESLIRYSQRLDALIDRPDAEAEYPQTVRRLQRLRAARARQRSARVRLSA